jgi:hypothetical protein
VNDKRDDEKKLRELMKQHCSERKQINESTLLSNLDDESSHHMLSSLLAADDATIQRYAGKSTRDVIEALLSDVNQNISSTQQVINNMNAIMVKHQEIEIDDSDQQDVNNHS